jgi:beta-glucanase (GH16 family)
MDATQRRRIWPSFFLISFFVLLCFPVARGANVLSNAGFEEGPSGTDVHPIAGWQWYGADWDTFTETDPAHAHSGNAYFKVFGSCFCGNHNYAGIFQDITCASGTIYTANGWGFSRLTDAIHGQDELWIEVTFRDASSNAIALYRSPIVSSNNLSQFGGLDTWFNLGITNQWSFTNSGGVAIAIGVTNTATNLVAPAGTAFARYQIVFHQGPDNANGSAYFDDCTLNEVSLPGTQWNLVWTDEFDGSSINTNHWKFETGNNNGWGNGELEYYTSRSQNAYVSNGVLHIVALKESFNGFNYTSARMKSQGLFAKAYGRFEFRAKLPSGLGYWPALWFMGANFPSVGWPACGEIDLMENKGSIDNQVGGTIHYSDSANNHLQAGSTYTFPAGGSTTNFHVYRLDWTTNSIKWYVDNILYQTRTTWSSSTGPYPAPFNQPFYILMNMAIGGQYLGSPSTNTINANTVFPGDMQVDYVRVSDLTAPLQISATQTNGQLVLSWPANIVCHLQAQTNSFGLTTNWWNVTNAATPYVVPLVPTNASVFYRLQSP